MRETTNRAESCGAWGGCPLPRGHNMGKADIPENHGKPRKAVTTVYIVVTEWNRPHDVDGAATIEGAAFTEEGAKRIGDAHAAYLRKEFGHKRRFMDNEGEDGTDDSDWDFDILIEPREVQP